MYKKIILIFLVLFSFDNYSQNKIPLYERIKNKDNKREKRIHDFLIKENSSKKFIYTNGISYSLHDVIDGKPIYKAIDNNIASIVTKTNHLQKNGSLNLNLDGSNIKVGVWDGGPVQDTHIEFLNAEDNTSRVQNFESLTTSGLSEFDDHATHVTGTIASKGVDENAKGMATNTSIIAYNFNNDTLEMVEVLQDESIDMFLSNHSYGVPIDQPNDTTLDPWIMGAYTDDAREIDDIASSYPYYLIITSAGNSGQTFYSGGLFNGYDKLTTDKNAKNNLVVANASAQYNPFTLEVSSISINNSSSQGPTDDLRVKPDITGYGTNVYSTTINDTYSQFTGTSMSSPNVTGSLVLLQQYYKSLNGIIMKASTLKGLVCHTAEDDENYIGPDPKFGWGILNLKESAELILENKNGKELITELTLKNKETYTLNFNVTGEKKVIATLSWTDVPGIAISGEENLNNQSPRLINDLDIRIIKDDVTFYPWSLIYSDSSGFSNTNVKDNYVDNVEKIEIQLPDEGNYKLVVSHKNELESHELFGSREQDFSLILSGSNLTTLSNPSNNIKDKLSIWPNPASDFLNVTYSTSSISNIHVKIHDSFGRLIYTKSSKPINEITSDIIDISKFSVGFYTISVVQDKSISVRKIIID